MISFWRIFWLEFVSLTRSKMLALLTLASVGWMLVFPHVVRGDGTEQGLRELAIRYSLGGVFALLVVTLLSAATGAIARERAAKRLQLTLVRPVRRSAVVLGKVLAYVLAGALVLAVACTLLFVRLGSVERCCHVLSPLLPSPQEEAREMYESYMKDPDTPEAVRKAKKDVVLRLLARRAVDHYQTIPTNDVVSWKFGGLGGLGGLEGLGGLGGLGGLEGLEGLAIRLRFTNPMEMRQDVIGEFRIGDFGATVSNITQAVLKIPLKTSQTFQTSQTSQTFQTFQTSQTFPTSQTLTFVNRGTSALMLRPRRDIHLLVPADAFGWNLLRAYVAMVAILAFLVSVGMLLSATLGRPVALFVAIVALIVSEMSPSVIAQYPDELETNLIDRIGLQMTRAAAELTRPVSSLSPLEALAQGECVEPRSLVQTALVDMVVLPLAFALLAGFALPRKQDDV